jgi:hypothetical protein
MNRSEREAKAMIDMTYDPEADAVYLLIGRGAVDHQEEPDRSSMMWMRTAACSASRSCPPAKHSRRAIGRMPGAGSNARRRCGIDMPRSLLRLLAFLIACLAAGPASAADIRVMISAGFFNVYRELGPAFEKSTGHKLLTTRGPSVGDSPEAIPTRSRAARKPTW